MGFKIGQKVVYPNHGVGTIERIEQKQVNGNELPFYALRLVQNNSLILVPVCNADEVGLRLPISTPQCNRLFEFLGEDFSFVSGDWKERFREFSEKMRSGDIFEVADVLKKLTFQSRQKPLSFREQRIFEKAQYLVISELAAVCRQKECQVEERVSSNLDYACAKHQAALAPRSARAAGAH